MWQVTVAERNQRQPYLIGECLHVKCHGLMSLLANVTRYELNRAITDRIDARFINRKGRYGGDHGAYLFDRPIGLVSIPQALTAALRTTQQPQPREILIIDTLTPFFGATQIDAFSALTDHLLPRYPVIALPNWVLMEQELILPEHAFLDHITREYRALLSDSLLYILRGRPELMTLRSLGVAPPEH